MNDRLRFKQEMFAALLRLKQIQQPILVRFNRSAPEAYQPMAHCREAAKRSDALQKLYDTADLLIRLSPAPVLGATVAILRNQFSWAIVRDVLDDIREGLKKYFGESGPVTVVPGFDVPDFDPTVFEQAAKNPVIDSPLLPGTAERYLKKTLEAPPVELWWQKKAREERNQRDAVVALRQEVRRLLGV